jgi:hypothetical protein
MAEMYVRRCLGALFLALAAGCGGGGGGSAVAEPPPDPRDIGASVSTSHLLVERDLYDRSVAVGQRLSLLVARAPAEAYYSYSYTSNALTHVGSTVRATNDGVDFQLVTAAPGTLARGSYSDTITIELCLDSACQRHVLGSPITVTVQYVVGYFAPTQAGMDPLAVMSRVALPHDLVDAAYSKALDAVISVSGLPTPALNVYELSTGTTRSVALATPPSALSLSPDSLRAVVGHDGAVSVVDLAGQPTVVARHGVSLAVGALLFDSPGRAHVFGDRRFNHNPIHALDLATGMETRSLHLAYGVVHAALHPAGGRLYYANRGVSPDDIFRMDLLGAVPAAPLDSPYHGEHAMCGRVWPASNGNRLYTGCGNTFTSSSVTTEDMLYAGALPLSARPADHPWGYEVTSLSDFPGEDRIVLLERSRYLCDAATDRLFECFTHLSLHAASTLALTSRHSLPPITVGADRFAQVGRFVFYRTNGQVVLLSELRGAPDAATGVRLSLLP